MRVVTRTVILLYADFVYPSIFPLMKIIILDNKHSFIKVLGIAAFRAFNDLHRSSSLDTCLLCHVNLQLAFIRPAGSFLPSLILLQEVGHPTQNLVRHLSFRHKR